MMIDMVGVRLMGDDCVYALLIKNVLMCSIGLWSVCRVERVKGKIILELVPEGRSHRSVARRRLRTGI